MGKKRKHKNRLTPIPPGIIGISIDEEFHSKYEICWQALAWHTRRG